VNIAVPDYLASTFGQPSRVGDPQQGCASYSGLTTRPQAARTRASRPPTTRTACLTPRAAVGGRPGPYSGLLQQPAPQVQETGPLMKLRVVAYQGHHPFWVILPHRTARQCRRGPHHKTPGPCSPWWPARPLGSGRQKAKPAECRPSRQPGPCSRSNRRGRAGTGIAGLAGPPGGPKRPADPYPGP
jgi:hypothetical protein